MAGAFLNMHTTDGIILKKTDTGEADIFFTMYTKDFGKIRAFAQGIKKEGAKLRGHLEPLSVSKISFVLGRNGERLTHANLVYFWPAIRGTSEKLKAAHRIAEHVDAQCLPGQKDECVWSLLMESFLVLEKGAYSEEIAERFETRLAKCLGTA